MDGVTKEHWVGYRNQAQKDLSAAEAEVANLEAENAADVEIERAIAVRKMAAVRLRDAERKLASFG